MIDKKNQTNLAPKSRRELACQPPSSSSIHARMTRDILERSRKEGLATAGHFVGGHQLRETDYRQTVLWAENLGMTPEELLTELASGQVSWRVFQHETSYSSVLLDGRFKNLVWDFELLPRFVDEWIPGLAVEQLVFTGCANDPVLAQLAPQLPNLKELVCDRFMAWNVEKTLKCLDLNGVPQLRRLNCSDNLISKLDLRPVQKLSVLDCSFNPLSELDLFTAPQLTELCCNSTQLSKLNLSQSQSLTKLSCGSNQLTELDLRPVPRLSELKCSKNQLSQIDLLSVPDLKELLCCSNPLTGLDLQPVPGLTALKCTRNGLTELKLPFMPNLNSLICRDNRLTKLNLRSAPALTNLTCQGNQISELDLSVVPLLKSLACDKSVVLRNVPPYCEVRKW